MQQRRPYQKEGNKNIGKIIALVVVNDSCPTQPRCNYVLKRGFTVNALLVSTGMKG